MNLIAIPKEKFFLEDPNSKFYTYFPEGAEHASYLARITAIISSVMHEEFLSIWRGRVGNEAANRVLVEACDYGHAAHDALEKLNHIYCQSGIGGELVEIYPGLKDLKESIRHHVEKWHAWACKNLSEILFIEQRCVSVKYGFAGTTDLVARLKDGSLAIIDFKTSKSMSKKFGLQMAAYKLALIEMSGGDEEIKNCVRVIVRFEKEEPTKEIDVKNYDLNKKEGDREMILFLYVLELFKAYYQTDMKISEAKEII